MFEQITLLTSTSSTLGPPTYFAVPILSTSQHLHNMEPEPELSTRRAEKSPAFRSWESTFPPGAPETLCVPGPSRPPPRSRKPDPSAAAGQSPECDKLDDMANRMAVEFLSLNSQIAQLEEMLAAQTSTITTAVNAAIRKLNAATHSAPHLAADP